MFRTLSRSVCWGLVGFWVRFKFAGDAGALKFWICDFQWAFTSLGEPTVQSPFASYNITLKHIISNMAQGQYVPLYDVVIGTSVTSNPYPGITKVPSKC